MKNKVMMILATGFGLGLSPVASGTFGSMLGVAIVLAMCRLPWYGQVLIAVALASVAVPICGIAEKQFKEEDDGRIVADEYMTFPLCAVGIPWLMHPWFLAVIFVVNRLLDIIKPPPAWQAQRLPGGIGVVADDIVSSLYALALNHVLWVLMFP
ncbi:MAG: phosphatidylglycerophosphatase A [Lentisphaerae bacterium]|nr:phosphatidylglycerophosphatase A [Lentisphaerota bacterium]